jgi:hypothetical protein
MFGSNFVEIGIGLSLLFLLLSLMCSISSESVSKRLAWRAEMLETGIRELLHDPVVAQQLYRHPLVTGLGRKSSLALNRISRILGRVPALQRFIQKRVDAWEKPSYIPSQLFARAMLDTLILLPRVAPCNAIRDALRLHANEAIRPLVARMYSAELEAPEVFASRLTALAESIGKLEEDKDARARLLELVEAAKCTAGAPRGAEPRIEQVRVAIDKLEDRDLRRALTVILERDEVSDIAGARAAIAQWFDDGMDRVSGWYKRRSQQLVFGIALVITVALNIDTLLIADRLSRDATLRSLVVAAGEGASEQLKDLQPKQEDWRPSTPPAPDAVRDAPAPAAASAPATEPAGPPPPGMPPPATPDPPSPTPAPSNPKVSANNSTGAPAAIPRGDDPEDLGVSLSRYKKLKAEIDKMHLPIGWPTDDEVAKAAERRAERQRAADAAALLERAAAEQAEKAAKDQEAIEKAAKEIAPGTAKEKVEKVIAVVGQAVADANQARVKADAARASAARAREEAAVAERDAFNERGWPEDWKSRGARLLGWLFTAFAASLGAQFWFDVLGKIMNLRMSGKKPEKSPTST